MWWLQPALDVAERVLRDGDQGRAVRLLCLHRYPSLAERKYKIDMEMK